MFNRLNNTHYLAVAVLALMLGLMLRSCLQRTPTATKPTVSADFPSSDTVRVAVKDNTLEVQTPTGTQFKYVPEEGQAVIDVKHVGAPVITVTNKGLTHKFGISVMLADRPRLGGDCELAYWNRFGFHLGLGFGRDPFVVGFASGSYQLDQLHLNNTSLWVGYTTNRAIAVGLRVGF